MAGEIPKNVSEAVFRKVNSFMEGGASNSKIDTQQEYDKLAEYLSGNERTFNNAEKNFINEKLAEGLAFLQAEKTKEFMTHVTQAAKDLVKQYSELLGNKDSIDTPIEAEGLLKELNNPNNDFNEYDKDYIRNVLNESKLLPEESIQQVESKGDVSKTNEVKNPKPILISGTVYKKGKDLAANIKNSINKGHSIGIAALTKQALDEVTSENAFVFFSQLDNKVEKGNVSYLRVALLRSGTTHFDTANQVTVNDWGNAVFKLLDQAAEMNLDNTPQYANLKNTIADMINKADEYCNNPDEQSVKLGDVKPSEYEPLERAISDLLQIMKKYVGYNMNE